MFGLNIFVEIYINVIVLKVPSYSCFKFIWNINSYCYFVPRFEYKYILIQITFLVICLTLSRCHGDKKTSPPLPRTTGLSSNLVFVPIMFLSTRPVSCWHALIRQADMPLFTWHIVQIEGQYILTPSRPQYVQRQLNTPLCTNIFPNH